MRLLFSLRVKLEVVVDGLDNLEQCFLSHVTQIVLGPPERVNDLLLADVRLFKLLLELLEELLRVGRYLLRVLRFDEVCDLLRVLLGYGLERAEVGAVFFLRPPRAIQALRASAALYRGGSFRHTQILRVLLFDRVQPLHHGLLGLKDLVQIAQNRGKHAAFVLLLRDRGHRLGIVEFIRVEVVHGL